MAKPLRTVWLEPEEHPQASIPTPAPRRQSSVVARRSGIVILSIVIAVALVVSVASRFIETHSRIAQFEFDRQAMITRIHQLRAESAQLDIYIAATANANQVAQVAQQANMVFPPADQVQYVQVAPLVQPASSQFASARVHRSWFGQVSASLNNIFQRFGHGSAPAYAQD